MRAQVLEGVAGLLTAFLVFLALAHLHTKLIGYFLAVSSDWVDWIRDDEIRVAVFVTIIPIVFAIVVISLILARLTPWWSVTLGVVGYLLFVRYVSHGFWAWSSLATFSFLGIVGALYCRSSLPKVNVEASTTAKWFGVSLGMTVIGLAVAIMYRTTTADIEPVDIALVTLCEEYGDDVCAPLEDEIFSYMWDAAKSRIRTRNYSYAAALCGFILILISLLTKTRPRIDHAT